ncbi:hypothetical protein [Escherichia coli]|uniref:hypothetical protein n=1 Tax=Escherichia coli TaxID=562 RepID=UPI001910E79F|nr:hypothetical protein [Escherichia coli]
MISFCAIAFGSDRRWIESSRMNESAHAGNWFEVRCPPLRFTTSSELRRAIRLEHSSD